MEASGTFHALSPSRRGTGAPHAEHPALWQRTSLVKMRARGLGVLLLRAGVVAVLIMGMFARPTLADPHDISVGGVWAFRITHGARGRSASERVVSITRRLTTLLSIPVLRRTGIVLEVRPSGPNAVILAGPPRLSPAPLPNGIAPEFPIRLVTVTPQDAEGTQVTPLELARQWARRLAEGLARALPLPYPPGP